MVHNDAIGALFRLQVKLFREPYANVLLRLQQAKYLRLVLEIGARWVAEGVARAAISLMEKVGDARRVVGGDAEELAGLLVRKLGEGFGGFHREAMQVEVLGEVAGFE